MFARGSKLLNPGSLLPAQRLHRQPCTGTLVVVNIIVKIKLGGMGTSAAHDC